MKKNIVFPRILALLALALVILWPVEPLVAQSGDVNTRINDIGIRSDQLAQQRQQVRQNLNKANQFAEIAAAWSARLSQAEAELRNLEDQKRSGNYNIYDNRQLDDQLQAARQKLESIKQLDGGQDIDGVTYGSFERLQDEVKQKSGEALQLNTDYLQLSQELKNLDQERDRLISQAFDQEKLQLQADKSTLQCRQEDLNDMQSVLGDDRLWILKATLSIGFAPPHMSRELVISALTNQYLYQLQTTPGMKFDSRELAARIKDFKAQSDGIKSAIRDQLVPEAIREINELQRRIQRLEGGSPGIQGCWVMMFGSENYPVLEITKIRPTEFEAILTRVGQLKFFSPGDKLFSVKRINDNTYDGVEYSFAYDGRPVQVGLRLVVSDDGASISYRSDAVLVLRRCN